MTKKFYPFFIALFLHVLIIIISSLLIDDVPTLLITQTKNLINVNFNSGGDTGGKAGEKITKQLSSSKTNTNQLNAPTLQISPGSTANTSVGGGTGNGSSEVSGLGIGISFSDAIVSFKEPTYPRLALRREIEGSLKIKIVISSEGVPQEIIVLSSSGHEILDSAAIEAVKFWRFESQAKPYFVLKTIVFQIK